MYMYIIYVYLVLQVSVDQLGYNPQQEHYHRVQEADENIPVCLQTNGIIREPLYVHVETTHSYIVGSKPAIGML